MDKASNESLTPASAASSSWQPPATTTLPPDPPGSDRGLKRPAPGDVAGDSFNSSTAPPDFDGKRKGRETDVKGAAQAPVKVEPPVKKKRRRAALNCAECRRLKLKCNRQVPCDQCEKRGCGSFCPSGVRGKDEKYDVDTLQKRIQELEALLQARSESPTQERERQPSSSTMPPPATTLRPAPCPPASTSPTTLGSGGLLPSKHSPLSSFEPSPPELPLGLGASGEEAEDERSFGTLILGEGGRQKWIGPRAGSEWLQEGPGEDGLNTPYPGALDQVALAAGERKWKDPGRAFPFTNTPLYTLDEVLDKIPSKSDARALIEAYYRFSDYNYSVIRRSSFDEHARAIYAALGARTTGDLVRVHPHQLALYFQVLATGCQFNLELAANDPIGDYYHGLAQCCLTLGHFIQKPTLAACQTLHIMGHYLLSTSPQSGGEKAWPIWGIAMRCCISMGLHRDGSKWDLEPQVTDERRLVFWETHTADTLQSSCFSRPQTLSLGTYDTELPVDEDAVEAGLDIGFSTLKFQLATIINGMLSQVMKISPPTTYSAVTRLWHKIFDFEKNLPFHWRCRPAWEALISISGSPEEAVKTSPEINKLDLRLNFQRHTLASNIADAVMFLQRPYFTKALYERPDNPCLSKYASSFLAVFERCLVQIRVNKSMSTLYPALTLRQWFFWYHTFTAAVCMSTITILAPDCPFAAYALYELEGVVALFASAPEGSRPRSTLPALVKFLERSQERMAKKTTSQDPFSAMANVFGAPRPDAEASSQLKGEEDQEHLALLGWTTRLVKSLRGQKRHGVSISHLVNPSGSSNGEPSPDARSNAMTSSDHDASIGHAQPISDDYLASLSDSVNRFGANQGSVDSGPFSTLGGNFPLPTDFASTTSLSPDPKDVFDYNSIAQFNGFMPTNNGDNYENIEWDGLAAQFMLGSTSAQPASTPNPLLPY